MQCRCSFYFYIIFILIHHNPCEVWHTDIITFRIQELTPEELATQDLGLLRPEDIAEAAKNLILHGKPGEVISVSAGEVNTWFACDYATYYQGNKVYCYPDTQLALLQLCEFCHSVLSSLCLARPGEMVSSRKLKLAFTLLCFLFLMCVIFIVSVITKSI